MISFRAAFLFAAVVFSIVPIPSALADSCITPTVRTRADGLLVLADADGQAIVFGTAVPDPGSGLFAAVVIRPPSCTSAGPGGLLDTTTSSAPSGLQGMATFLPLP